MNQKNIRTDKSLSMALYFFTRLIENFKYTLGVNNLIFSEDRQEIIILE